MSEHNYETEVINTFLKATISALQSNCGIPPEKGLPFIKEKITTYGDYSAVIHLSGKQSRGVVALSFETKCVEALARCVFQNAEMDYNQELLSDFSGEMCNQVAGNTQSIFQNAGNRFEITPPTLIYGKEHQIIHKIKAPCLMLPFTWGGGRFFTEFIFENTAEISTTISNLSKDKNIADSGDITFLLK